MRFFGNVSLSALTAASVSRSPLVSSPRHSFLSSFSVTRFSLCGFFSSFYASSSNAVSLSVSRSTFSKFSESVVRVSAEDHSQKYFTSSFDNEEKNEEYRFDQCVFQKTRTSTNGGAVLIFSQTGTLNMNQCGFTICLATNNGGGIEFEGKEYTITKTCFLGCLAVQFGQAIDVQGADSLKGRMDFNSIQQCATARSPGLSQSFFMRHGMHALVSINSTSNHVKDMGACFTIAHTTQLSLHHSTFIDNHGHNNFWLHKVKPSDELTYCNILLNSANKDLGMFTFENTSAKFLGFIFIDNKCPVYFISGSLYLSKCLLDVKRSSKIISNCILTFSESGFGLKSLQKRPLNSFVTWECWAMGAPSPTVSQSLVPIDHVLEEAVLGVWILAGVVVLGFVASYIGFAMMLKTQDKVGVQNTQMTNIEMRDM